MSEGNWLIREDVAFVQNDDRVAIVRLDALEALPAVLTGSAGVIWAALQNGGSSAEIAAAAASALDVDATEIAAHVHDFLLQLESLQLARKTS